jgi:hypothetical protein
MHGLIELIWNAVDADAKAIHAEIGSDEFHAVASVRVRDDGHGMTETEALRAFGALGESWKKAARRSRSDQRVLHGSDGKGRYGAFGIGSRVTWTSVARGDDGRNYRVGIEASLTHLDQFEISSAEPIDVDPGTDVVVTDIAGESAGQLVRPSVLDNLCTTFALYLESYRIVITWRGDLVEPVSIQEHRQTYALEVPGLSEGAAALTVIEWKKPVARALHLCDANGVALHEVAPGIQAPGFEFTAYVRWDGFRDLGSQVLLAELGHEEITPVVDAARDALRGHFKRRMEQRRSEMVRRWKTENTYPYRGQAATELERAQRELFDVVAVTAAKAVEAAEPAARRLSLRLIREAMETNPTSLRRVLAEVVDLNKEQLDELVNVLDRTSLPAVVSGARIVADRIAFLHGLNALLFDRESRRQTLERRQLHRILAAETWIFGEEYALSGDDDRLLVVLRKHLGLLDLDTALAGTDPITRYDGTEAIPDLVLSRRVRHRDNQLEHLVVELKRPSVVIGRSEIQQIEDYAYAVSADERFNQPNVSWRFWIIGNDLDDFVAQKADSPDRAPGVVTQTKRYRVIAKTWAQVISDADHRMKFFEESLGMTSGRADGIAYLRQTHDRLLPEVLRADPPAQRLPTESPSGTASGNT